MENSGLDSLNETIDTVVDFLPQLGIALGLFVVFLIAGWVIGRLVRLALIRRGDQIHATFIGRLPVLVFAVLGLIVATDFLGLESIAAGLLAGGGATAIILGFAFREIGENFLAGIFLVFSRPFNIGDLIQSGSLSPGTVKMVALRNTHIRTVDGQDIFIPNAHIFNTPLINFTRDGLRRPAFTVGIDYHDPIEEARRAIFERVALVDGVLETPPPVVSIKEFPASYVLLEISFWIDTFQGTDFQLAVSDAMEACRRAILDNGWTISADAENAVRLSGNVETAPADSSDAGSKTKPG